MNDLKQYYTTEEVAAHFETTVSRIRFYEREFNLPILLQGNKKAFTRKDLDRIGEIIALIDEENYNLSGAKAQMKLRKHKKDERAVVIEKLENIKSLLLKLKGE